MNENDGHEMLVARCKALKQILMDTLKGFAPVDERTIERHIEGLVEQLAPGCQHTVDQ